MISNLYFTVQIYSILSILTIINGKTPKKMKNFYVEVLVQMWLRAAYHIQK